MKKKKTEKPKGTPVKTADTPPPVPPIKPPAKE